MLQEMHALAAWTRLNMIWLLHSTLPFSTGPTGSPGPQKMGLHALPFASCMKPWLLAGWGYFKPCQLEKKTNQQIVVITLLHRDGRAEAWVEGGLMVFVPSRGGHEPLKATCLGGHGPGRVLLAGGRMCCLLLPQGQRAEEEEEEGGKVEESPTASLALSDAPAPIPLAC